MKPFACRRQVCLNKSRVHSSARHLLATGRTGGMQLDGGARHVGRFALGGQSSFCGYVCALARQQKGSASQWTAGELEWTCNLSVTPRAGSPWPVSQGLRPKSCPTTSTKLQRRAAGRAWCASPRVRQPHEPWCMTIGRRSTCFQATFDPLIKPSDLRLHRPIPAGRPTLRTGPS